MVKHWPGGGPEEGGRDGHFAYGKFAVYPGKNFETHLVPFVRGAFALSGKTKKASAVMPYYTISYDQETRYNENVGNGFSKYIVTDLLRQKYGYDGVVCTDWLITADEGKTPDMFAGKSWGVEKLSVAQRHYKTIMAGVDQFGGNNAKGPVMEAYEIGVKEHGESFMRKRFEESAVRLLKNVFRVGLFDNPYLDPAKSEKVVGNPLYMTAGYNAQLKSLILLKNRNHVLPLKSKITVYIPKRIIPAGRDWFGNITPERLEYPVNMDIVKKYFNVTDDAAKAEAAIVFVKSPDGGVGYSREDREKGGNGYVPISLQYGPYTASKARDHSIAAGDPVIDSTVTNRSYRGKTTTASNATDLQSILKTRTAMKAKPVIVIIDANKPMVMAEFEKQADAIVYGFSVMDQAVLEVINGLAEPSGLLPMQLPRDMQAVEEQKEDVPHDMNVYVDSEGNTYDFAFGMNWRGVIKDQRTAKYRRK
jgi:beta-glucosidase